MVLREAEQQVAYVQLTSSLPFLGFGVKENCAEARNMREHVLSLIRFEG